MAFAALTLASPAHPATFVVSNTAELEAAVATSNASAGPDTIVVLPGHYPISNDLRVSDDLTVDGPSSGAAVLDGGGTRTVFFPSGFGTDLRLDDLNIQNANAAVHGAARGELHLDRLTITNSDLGVWSSLTEVATVTNSTLSGNETGILHESGTLDLRNVTITGSTGLGLENYGPTTATNTIVAANPGGDCENEVEAGSRNLDRDGSCGPTFATAAPGLGPLQDNGGSTLTHALLSGSPAIDTGTNVGCPPTDQRGVARPKNLVCDIGAVEKTPFEFESAGGTVGPGGTVTTDTEGDGATASDPVETSVTHPDGGTISIQEGPDAAAEFGFIGQRVRLAVDPDGTPARPLVIVFRIDSSVIPPGQSAATIQVSKNTVPVPPCTGAPQAIPDPCVSDRLTVGDDAQITVLTSEASDWDFAPGAGPLPSGSGRIDGKGSFTSPPRNRFNLEVAFDPSTAAGHVAYHDRSAKEHLRSDTITRATCTDNQAVIEGTGMVGKDAVRFRIEVTDGGESGAADTLSISWPGYAAGGPLDKGDIDVSCP